MSITLVQWSFKTTHLYLEEETILSNGEIVSKGTICGLKPRNAKFTMNGKAYAMLTIEPGSKHIRWGNWAFCKNCQKKLGKYYANKVADELGLPKNIAEENNYAS